MITFSQYVYYCITIFVFIMILLRCYITMVYYLKYTNFQNYSSENWNYLLGNKLILVKELFNSIINVYILLIIVLPFV